FPSFGWITFEPSAIRSIPPRLEEAPNPAPATAAPVAQAPDASQLTPQELDELLNIRDQNLAPARPFLSTWPGLLLLAGGVLLVLGLLAAAGLAVVWRRGFSGV